MLRFLRRCSAPCVVAKAKPCPSFAAYSFQFSTQSENKEGNVGTNVEKSATASTEAKQATENLGSTAAAQETKSAAEIEKEREEARELLRKLVKEPLPFELRGNEYSKERDVMLSQFMKAIKIETVKHNGEEFLKTTAAWARHMEEQELRKLYPHHAELPKKIPGRLNHEQIAEVFEKYRLNPFRHTAASLAAEYEIEEEKMERLLRIYKYPRASHEDTRPSFMME